jgi:hypothetical protein
MIHDRFARDKSNGAVSVFVIAHIVVLIRCKFPWGGNAWWSGGSLRKLISTKPNYFMAIQLRDP